MAEIIISIVAKVAEYLVELAIRQGQYFLCVKKVIKDVENEKEELTSERDRLQGRIKKAKEGAEVVEEPVEKWLNDVENLLKEVEDLLKDVEDLERDNNCFPGWCPTWKRYCLCEKMVKKTEAMGKFIGKSNIQPFSHRAPLPGIQYEFCENFTYFESTKVAHNQLLEALRDERVYMIGVYGMGGSGKTTLVTEAGKMVESELFEKVILIVVSQNPNIKDIQDKMAKMLEMELKEVCEEERAQRLWLSLKEKKRILVIVDDLWTKFDLKHIGIRLDDNYNGKCKVLITTRNERVCSSMDCQKKIHLKLLSKDESWTLFKKCANIDDGFSKSLDDNPRKVCYECKELPIAIATVGSSLKGKSGADWKVALHNLRHPEAIDDDYVEEGVKDVFNCLKFSYDYLERKEEKLLFLICSMFPEDYNISTEDLIRYAVGVGQQGKISLDEARDFTEANINKLLRSCLLMHADKGKHYVKMHDLVRDTALWIGKRSENCKFLFSLGKPLRDLAEDDTIGDCFAISSWYNENQICKDDAQLKAPNLEILLLNMMISRGSLDLSDATFEEMKGLKVFAIVNNRYVYPSLLLPQSTQLLTNLQTLRLNHWELGDISFIASLTRIEVLDLQNCRFNALPNDIEKLKGLKLLDLSNCHIEENYNGAIGKCSRLEELYFSGTNEYHHQSIMDIVTLPNLQRFIINNIAALALVGVQSKRALAVKDFNISNLGDPKKNLLQIADSVHLRRLSGGCKNIFPDMVGVVGSMNGLTSLLLEECQEIECIFDTTSDSKIPGLVDLRLKSMENLKELCRGPPLQVLHFFEKLERLQIEDCRQLSIIFPRKCNLQNLKILTIKSYDSFGHNTTTAEVLFSTSVAQSLQQLEELNINGCHDLKHIVACEREHVSNASEEIVPTPSRSRFTMPSLKSIVISRCRKLESIFQIDCVECQIELPRLEYMKLQLLENLIRICPENYGVKWPSLRNVYVNDCPKLSTSWIAMMADSEQRQEHLNEQKQLLSTLKRLELHELPQLNHIPCVGFTPGQILDLQCLQHLEIYNCENLKYLFSMAVIRSLPELISLRILCCEELEQIIVANEELVQLSNAEVYFPKLTDIDVFGCNKLESLFSVAMVRMLPQLSNLSIRRASQLKEVYRQCSGDDTINEMEIVLPNMTKIRLYFLPSFVDICQGRKFKAEKLQELDISECPKTCPSLKAIQYFFHMGTPAVEGSSVKLEALLSQNFNTRDIRLLLAASEGDKKKIGSFLFDGAKYDVKDIDGRTALDRANDEIKDFILNFSVSSSNTDEEGNS